MAEVASENPDALIVMGGDLNDEPGTTTLDALTGGGMNIVEEADTWTYSYSGSEQQIDHLVYPVDQAGIYVPNSGQAMRDGGGGFYGSDHGALVAEFLIPD